MSRDGNGLSSAQQWALVLLRTLIGWHFLYEGYFKMLHPAWSRAGAPLGDWSSAGYLKAATGPAAALFHALGGSPWVAQLDTLVALSLLLVGLSLLLGLFTELGCVGALLLLALFYVSAMPTLGVPEPHSEGAYLLVNKNLIEAAAVFVLLQFRTGRIAGLDCLRWRKTPAAAQEVSV
jgi:thiosulfate dehydrogenase [quinone] large subunit